MMVGTNTGSEAVWKHIPEGSVGVEIGVWKGDSSEKFLRRASRLHLVDPWAAEAYEGSDEFGDYEAYLKRYAKLAGAPTVGAFNRLYDDIYQSVVKRFQGKPVTIHRCTSAEFFEKFNDSVDWVYIDGSHSHEGCLDDLRNALKITEHFIFGDDYGNKPGVTAAVEQFISEENLEVEFLGGNQYKIMVKK